LERGGGEVVRILKYDGKLIKLRLESWRVRNALLLQGLKVSLLRYILELFTLGAKIPGI
jgi:hypothetical protein